MIVFFCDVVKIFFTDLGEIIAKCEAQEIWPHPRRARHKVSEKTSVRPRPKPVGQGGAPTGAQSTLGEKKTVFERADDSKQANR